MWLCTMDNKLKKLLIIYLIYKRRNKNTRSQYGLLIEKRILAGTFVTHYSKLRMNERKFKSYFRMSILTFDELFGRIDNRLQKYNSSKLSIHPMERLAVTLRYLASGNTFTDLHFSYYIGIATISQIVRQVLSAVFNELKDECIPTPSENQWKDISQGFFTNANFPNCLGAIDGKHIRIICPRQIGSLNFNYKKYNSIVLFAMCDAAYNFTYINVGASSSNADSAIFRKSQLYTRLGNKTLSLPGPQELPIICAEEVNQPNVRPKLPFVIVGDEAFGLSSHVMRPYARDNGSYKQKIFNYRLSRARRYIECTFGMVSNKFRLFHRPINVKMDLAQIIVKAACVLHNFIRKRDGYRIRDTIVVNGFSGSLPRQQNEGDVIQGSSVRNLFAEYFMKEGKLSWQDR